MSEKPKPPCQAVILVRYEICERLPNGQVTGVPIERESKLFTFIGKDQEEVKAQVVKFMERIENVEEKKFEY